MISLAHYIEKAVRILSDMIVRFACPKSVVLIPVAVEVFYRQGTFDPLHLKSAEDLAVRIPNPGFVEAIVAKPYAMNWSIVVHDLRDGEIYECPKIEFEHLQGWRAACGVSSGHDANGITVGIIDIGFANYSSFEHMELITDRSEDDLPLESHGSRVSRIIGKKSGDPIGGICSNIDLVFYDVGFNGPNGDDAGKWETESVIDAIHFLSEQKGCSIINISGGLINGAQSLGLQNAVNAAKNLGSICIAAAGNDPCQEVPAPASYGDVIGVGGIGVCSTAPKGTYANFVESASQHQGFRSNPVFNHTFFHDINTSFGVGLDVVAPSVGIALPIGDNQVMDLGGTSYAAPIISSILALSASHDNNVISTLGELRWKRLKEALTTMCYDIGLPKERQGLGLPVWSARA